MVMVTDAGIYIFQLFDNHAATYSALILGCTEVTVMAWVYGADNFLEDLRHMLGFYPYPRVFWYWAWKLLSPSIVLVFSYLLFSYITLILFRVSWCLQQWTTLVTAMLTTTTPAGPMQLAG